MFALMLSLCIVSDYSSKVPGQPRPAQWLKLQAVCMLIRPPLTNVWVSFHMLNLAESVHSNAYDFSAHRERSHLIKMLFDLQPHLWLRADSVYTNTHMASPLLYIVHTLPVSIVLIL